MSFRTTPQSEPTGGFQIAGSGPTGSSASVPLATTTTPGQVQPDGETITVTSSGVISAESGGFDYSTNEFDTGQKWIDGKTIYGKTFTVTELFIPNNDFVGSFSVANYSTYVNHIVSGQGLDQSAVTPLCVGYDATDHVFKIKGAVATTLTGAITIFYTKGE